MEDIKNALPVTKENLNVSYFIIKEGKLEELKEVYKQNVEESNKKSKRANLIRAMQNAINYGNTEQNETSTGNQKPHPILKLTHILDRINDNEYINNYSDYAEECFKYTKSAEGLFINENINGIMQLMINKKTGIRDMKNITDSYDESKMFYNKKNSNSNSNFNNTLVFENLYSIYDNNSELRKIDNIYAFFVVANISNNKRIKQKLICNATKDENGYKKDLGWDCDEEALDKEREEALIKQKKEIEEEKNKKEKDKIKFINGMKDNLKGMNPNLFNRVKNSEPISSIKQYFNMDKKKTEEFLQNFNRTHGNKNKEIYIEEFAKALYNEKEKNENKKLINNANETKIEEIKNAIEQGESDIIRNFKELDTNGDGVIDIYEFKSAIKRQLEKIK